MLTLRLFAHCAGTAFWMETSPCHRTASLTKETSVSCLALLRSGCR